MTIQENYGLDQESPHGDMFDNQASLEESIDPYDPRGDVKQSSNSHNQEQSFQNNTLPQLNEQQDDQASEEELQEEIQDDDQEEEQPLEEDEDDDAQAHYTQQTQQPLLFVDINLGGDEQERIVVYEGDTAVQLALNFC